MIHPSDIETITFSLGQFEAEVATNAGPRVTGFRRPGGSDLFARLGDAGIDDPSVGRFRFLGGHRLWRAPEVPTVTYQPDDAAVDLFRDGPRLTIAGAPDHDGIVKRVVLMEEGERAVVAHELENTGSQQIEVAPWAITQFTPGGTAYMPLGPAARDLNSVLPDRRLVLWPYTDWGAPELRLGAEMITISASDRSAKLKIGTENNRGWIAYHLDNELFVKWANPHDHAAAYVDKGASIQCYRDERFLELETLGPLRTLSPGDTVVHSETWRLFDADSSNVQSVLERLTDQP